MTAAIIRSDPPGAAPATGAAPLVATANPRREYVAGDAGHGFWQPNARALNWRIDDLADDLGDSIYEVMHLDAQVRACTNILKTAIIADGLRIAPAVDPKSDDYAKAREMAELCTRVLDDIETPIDDVIFNLLDALYLGNKVAENNYALDSTYTGRQQIVLRSVKVKPRKATSFVVDPYMNVLGLLATVPGTPFAASPSTALIDPAQPPPNLLPREKFSVLTFRPHDNDPRGSSIYRAAYTPWNAKMQLWPAWIKYLSQFATPTVVGTTAEGAVPNETTNKTAEEELLETILSNFMSGGAIVVPYTGKVELIYSQGDGRAFLSGFEHCDKQIGKAIVHQHLATDEGHFQARAAAQVHQDVLGTIIRQMKQAIQRIIRRDIFMQMIRWNYGDAARYLTPTISLGDVEQQDFSTTATAIAALATAAFLDPSQYPAVDKMLGLPERTIEQAILGDQAAQAAINTAVQALQPHARPEPGAQEDGQGGKDGKDGKPTDGKTPPPPSSRRTGQPAKGAAPA